MPLIKYTASADTTITDAYRPYTTNRAYYANMGAADSLEIFSIAHSGSSPEKSRILVNFPVEKILQNRQEGKIPSSGSVNFILKLYNVRHSETLPKNYSISIKPISGSWDEGYGLDLENYTDIGQLSGSGYGVNWKFRKFDSSSVSWSSDGGDFYSGYDKVFYFDDGTEDIEVDVTNVIEDQISGIISPSGFGIMLSGSYENGSYNTTYYTKRFSARSSEYFYKKPVLEARWDSGLEDDRDNFYFESPNLSSQENSGSLLFYNRINGKHKNLPSDTIPYVRILDTNNNIVINNITTTKVANGIYRAKFSLTGSTDANYFDEWYSGSNIYHKGLLECKVREFEEHYNDSSYVFSIKNLKSSYSNKEKATFRIFGREKNWSPTIYKISNTDIESLSFNNLYYKIIRIIDNLTIVDFGVNPIGYTKCSYDMNGNYFELDTSIFEPGFSYGIKLMLLIDDNYVEIPDIFKFKVE